MPAHTRRILEQVACRALAIFQRATVLIDRIDRGDHVDATEAHGLVVEVAHQEWAAQVAESRMVARSAFARVKAAIWGMAARLR